MTSHQSAAFRFDARGSARTSLRALLGMTNGAEATDARPVLLTGYHGIPVRPPTSEAGRS